MLDSSFILGDEVERFENAFAKFSGVRHCIGVGNGTDALELALRAIGVGEGDEVILPANTFIATALATLRAGATPILADVDNDSYLIDPLDVEARLSSRTKVILPVHLYGQIAPIAALQKLASAHDLALVEDAAQAHGALRDAIGSGGFGVVTGTSFYPAKNLGAFGDGGAVLTESDGVARSVRALRNYGGEAKYDHAAVGFNSRLDVLQAVVLSAKLPYLAGWNDDRNVAAARYGTLLADLEQVKLPSILPGNDHVWHLYVIRVPERDRVLACMTAAGIGVGVHYPVPLHLQGALQHLGYGPGDFPVTERASTEVLSLPIYPGITSAQQEEVVDQLRLALR